jgi:VanZ family protein
LTGSSRRHGTPSPVLHTAQYRWLALGILVLAVYGNLIPFRYRAKPWDQALAAFRAIAWYDPSNLGARGDWIVSVVLFLILSYLLMAALCVDRGPRVGFWLAPVILLLCAALSVAIEFAQIYFPPRTVSLNDIAAENTGAVLGALLWIIGGQRITNWVRRVSAPTDLSGFAQRLLPGYLALLLIIALMPFDFTISPAELAVKVREHKIQVIPFVAFGADGWFPGLLKVATNAALFFPLGFLRVAALGPDARRRWWRSVVGFGLAIALIVEVLQLFIYSRVYDTTDIVTGVAGFALGAVAAERFFAAWRLARNRSELNLNFTPAPAGRWAALAALLLIWFGATLYVNWSPFDFTVDPLRFPRTPEGSRWGLRRMSWLPFVDYYWSSKYEALDQFLRKSMSFVPLGVLCALALPMYRPWTAGVVVCVGLLLAIAIEVGRYFLPSHSPSVTDALLQCAGAWAGFRLTQRLRALLWADRTGLTGLHF